MINFFVYDSENSKLELNEPEILLIHEFKTLFQRDKTKDKTKFWKEITYIYLALCWKSPYSQYSEYERHEEALRDSGLTEKEFNDPDFREACRKFRSLQDSNKSIRMLEAAKRGVDKYIDYLDVIVDLNERDVNGKPIFDAKKTLETIASMHKLHEELVNLENLVKKDMTEQSVFRAGAVADFDPGDF